MKVNNRGDETPLQQPSHLLIQLLRENMVMCLQRDRDKPGEEVPHGNTSSEQSLMGNSNIANRCTSHDNVTEAAY